MKNPGKGFRNLMVIAVLMFIVSAISCKKEDKTSGGNSKSIVGDWSHVKQVGSFRNILTEIQLKADGSGNEYVLSITTGSSTPLSDLNFNWNTEKDSILNLNFVDGTAERYTYKLDAAQTRLTLTSDLGDEKEYIKM